MTTNVSNRQEDKALRFLIISIIGNPITKLTACTNQSRQIQKEEGSAFNLGAGGGIRTHESVDGQWLTAILIASHRLTRLGNPCARGVLDVDDLRPTKELISER